MYAEIDPLELLRAVPVQPGALPETWMARWDKVAHRAEELVLETLPETVELFTSGSTGAQRGWLRTREQLWTEAGMLAGLLAGQRPEAVLSFAPPRHVYGILVTVLVPARLGLPVWYRTQYGPMPPQHDGQRWAVMAIPWAFSLMAQRLPWVKQAGRLAVLHSTALLPAGAADLVAAAGQERVSITEIFGSTETGGVAVRRWSPENPPWELLSDVELVGADQAEERPMTVRSPRLAQPSSGESLTEWQMDDHVELLEARRFRFAGRRSRLVKVNGRRINLDELEITARSSLPGRDLALVPVADPVIGEHFDLVVVGDASDPVDGAALRQAFASAGIRPRRLRMVAAIDRSETGKLRRIRDETED